MQIAKAETINMAIKQTPNPYCSKNGKKPRRSHHKSRNGCAECKRRRVKCDELKPSCTRCTTLLGKCSYLPTANSVKDEFSLSSLPCTILSRSPTSSLYSEISPSSDVSISPTAPHVDVNPCAIASFDTDLYNHYLQHTSHTITLCEADQHALQIEMPKLALQNKSVFHSLLAASAACLCHDMILEDPPPDTSRVRQILMTGYQHFNLASERVRELISSPSSLTPEPLLASAILLVPFATSSQQINHWISSSSSMPKDSCKLLSSTPRDVIIIMRAIRTALQTLHHQSSSLTRGLSQLELASDDPSAEVITPRTTAVAPSRNHVILPILAATIQNPFAKLQQSLESALVNSSDDSKEALQACSTTFDILKHISHKIFPASNIDHISSFKPESVPLPRMSHWLHSFARRARDPLPTEPLTSFLLGVLVQAPQAYLDVVLPLLDQRLENPSDTLPAGLTREQALALDIYAHWSVLMFLVEEDSWWIGDLPIVTLTGMVNRYGDDFASRAWLETASRQEPWWPGSMLAIFREIKRHR